MSEQDNYIKILEKIAEIAVDTGVLKNEVGHIRIGLKETQEHIERINQQDIEQNKLLDEHILGVKTATERLEIEKSAREENQKLIEKQIQDLDNRLKRAEVLPNSVSEVKRILKKIIKWIAIIAPALAALYEIKSHL
jgi:hypothetical protein